jgi:hypothetical protein
MQHTRIYLIACALAAVLPLVLGRAEEPEHAGFPGWPTAVAGLALEPVELTAEDRAHALEIPGEFARFQAGPRHVLLRWVERPSHRVHSVSHCFRGAGWELRETGPVEAFDGRAWGTFVAERGAERLRVYERVEEASGRVHADTSAWYWRGLLDGGSGAAWWCAVVEPVERR